jgi:hypothetical protein
VASPPPSPQPISPTDLFDQPASGGRGLSVRGLLPSLAVNAIAPFIVYTVLTARGVSDVPALIVSGVFPVLGVVWGLVRTRRADVIGLVSLAFIVLGVATSVFTGNAQFILIKESMLTGVFGLVCLISLLAPKPLMFYFGRQFAGGGDPVRVAAYEDLWQYPTFRTVQRNLTLAWGFGYVAEALLRIALTFVLPIPVFLIVSPLMAFGVTIALIAWTMAYARRSARRGSARLAELARAQIDT